MMSVGASREAQEPLRKLFLPGSAPSREQVTTRARKARGLCYVCKTRKELGTWDEYGTLRVHGTW